MDIWDILFKFMIDGKNISVTNMNDNNFKMEHLLIKASHKVLIQNLEKKLEEKDLFLEKNYTGYNIHNPSGLGLELII